MCLWEFCASQHTSNSMTYENEVFDSTFSSFELLKKHLLKQQPDVIGIYTNLMTKLNVLRSFVL
jgi:hypothetical protein